MLLCGGALVTARRACVTLRFPIGRHKYSSMEVKLAYIGLANQPLDITFSCSDSVSGWLDVTLNFGSTHRYSFSSVGSTTCTVYSSNRGNYHVDFTVFPEGDGRTVNLSIEVSQSGIDLIGNDGELNPYTLNGLVVGVQNPIEGAPPYSLDYSLE